MKKPSTFFLLCAAVFITSCKKPEFSINSNQGSWYFLMKHSYFDSTGINIVKIPAGNYFIYKDAGSGQTDSVIVTQSIDSVALQLAGPGSPFPYFFSIYKLKLTSVSGSLPQIWFSGTAISDYPLNSSTISDPVKDSVFSFTNESNTLPAFWYPLQSSVLMQYNFFPALTIEGHTYTEVHQFSANNGLAASDPAYNETIFCWVKGIGIIKKVIVTGTSVKTFLLLQFGKI